MIKKAFLVFVMFVVMGNIYIIIFHPKGLQAQHQYHENLCKAEKFQFTKESIEVVILGSSLGNRINERILPTNWFKLTFSGYSSLEGLELITKSNISVKNVLIETNILHRSLNTNFINDVNKPIFSSLKHYLPAFKTCNQPVSLIYPYTAYLFYGVQNEISGLFTKKTISETIGIPKNNSNTQNNGSMPKQSDSKNPSFKAQYELYAENIDSTLIKNQLIHLRKYIQILESRNIKIVFYEMPIDIELRKMPRAIQIRKCFLNEFPKNRYNYIIAPDSVNYNTSDGIHMVGESINDYTIFLKEQIKNTISF
jgi:hypothetical protein